MNGLRKREKLNSAQLFTFTLVVHTSSLIPLRTESQLNSRPYVRKMYGAMEIHP